MRPTPLGGDGRWQRAVREHRAALAAFLEFVSEVPESSWDVPAGEGSWTPAEVTEHLALAYEATLRELEGGASMAPRVAPIRRTLFRWFLLPHMLFHRSMPRVRAPRETRPAPTGLGRAEQIDRLRELALRSELAYAERPAARLTHPYFGSLDRARTFRLAALHLEHHHRRLAAVLTRTD